MPQPRRRRDPSFRGTPPRYLRSPTAGARASGAARVRRRRLVVGGALGAGLIAVIVIALSVGGGSSGHKPSARLQKSRAVASHAARHAQRQKPASHPHRAAPAPGTLPQTRALPSSTTAQFKSLMATLWAGVVHDSTSRGMSAFFPKAAYLQVKAIPDAGADYENRLVHGFTLDIGAAHALLGADASSARLVSVRVPQEFAHWVDPGTCYNRDRLLRGAQCTRRLFREGPGPLVRHRLDDLMAGRLVRGPFRRCAAVRGG